MPNNKEIKKNKPRFGLGLNANLTEILDKINKYISGKPAKGE